MAPELPDECWELIFNRVGHHYRADIISLVCKHLLSVTSRLKRNLTISDPNIVLNCNVSHLLGRFNKLDFIDIRCTMSEQDYNHIIFCIARSGLDLQELNISRKQTKIGVESFRELGSNMKNLKILKCKGGVLKDSDLFKIANSIPQLEELDISGSVDCFGGGLATDKGIQVLANCKLMTKIVVGRCQLTENGIGFALRHFQNLKYLGIYGLKSSQSVLGIYGLKSSKSVVSSSSAFDSIFSYAAAALCELDIRDMIISDEFLCSIAKARLPLKKLSLGWCKNFTYSGLSFLLQECQSINHLVLNKVNFLTNQMMNDLSKFLRNITHIDIWSSPRLSDPTFFILTRNCPFLVNLRLGSIFIGGVRDAFYGDDDDLDFDIGFELEQNYEMKSLNLSFNAALNDESIRMFGLVCPNIQRLNLNFCSAITENGIGEILKSCPELTHLKVELCTRRKVDRGLEQGKKILGTGSDMSELNLEVLHISYTVIDDEEMALIGKRCPRLVKLRMRDCLNVTEKGVKEVLERCVYLKKINLFGCHKVNFDSVPWMTMMSLRPSLKKIVSPVGHVSKEEQRNLFLHYGCMVYTS